MKVFVQQDSIAAWIGLVGVAVGVLLSGVLDWWRGHLAERRDRRREMHRAADELMAAANALLVAKGAFGAPQARQESLLAWTQVMMAQAERIQRASEALIRLGPQGLAKAADDLATAAVDATASVSQSGVPGNVSQAIRNFATLSRQIRA